MPLSWCPYPQLELRIGGLYINIGFWYSKNCFHGVTLRTFLWGPLGVPFWDGTGGDWEICMGTPRISCLAPNPVLLTPSSMADKPSPCIWASNRSNGPVHSHYCQTMGHVTIEGVPLHRNVIYIYIWDVIQWELFSRSHHENFFVGPTGGPILECDRWRLKDIYGTAPNIKFGPNPMLLTPHLWPTSTVHSYGYIVNPTVQFIYIGAKPWGVWLSRGSLSITRFGLCDKWAPPIALTPWTVRTFLIWLFHNMYIWRYLSASISHHVMVRDNMVRLTL